MTIEFDIAMNKTRQRALDKVNANMRLFLIGEDIVTGEQLLSNPRAWNPIHRAETRYSGFSFEIGMNTYLVMRNKRGISNSFASRRKEIDQIAVDAVREALEETPELIGHILSRIINGEPAQGYTVTATTETLRPDGSLA